MGSRIMHAIIASKLADCLSISDKKSFLRGGIAPDAVVQKDLSHFYKGKVEDYSREIDYNGFLQKYNVHLQNHYILGYYSHLIADDIWLKGFYLPWLRNRMEEDPQILQLYHNDFRLLNGKLLEHYGFTNQLKEEVHLGSVTIIDLEEVKTKEVEAFLSHVLGDMEYNKDCVNENLNVFTFDQIVGYIETSVDKSINLIKQILR
ncbi:hydrolase [Bacillus sp. JJ1521]|uniref:hydrolase n=1 Tax=Bacillus sp. JJ1521 TaxID=3122957 RepID=UPI002FFFDA7A